MIPGSPSVTTSRGPSLLLPLGRGEVEGAEASMGIVSIASIKLVGCKVLGVLGETVSDGVGGPDCNNEPRGVGGADSNELGGVGGADCNEEVGGVGIADATGSLVGSCPGCILFEAGSVVANGVSVFEVVGCGDPPGVGATDATGSTVVNVESVFELLGCPVFKVVPVVGFVDNAGGTVSNGVGGPDCNVPGAVGGAVSNEPGGVGMADNTSGSVVGTCPAGSVFNVVGCCVPPGVGRGEAAGSVVDNVVSVFELVGCCDASGSTVDNVVSVFELLGVGAADASGSTVFEILGRKESCVVGTVGSVCAADGIAVLILLG